MPHTKSSSIDHLKDIPLREISPEEAAQAAISASNNEPTPSDDPNNDHSDPHHFLPSGSTVIRALMGIQKYSSYAFTGFLGLHLTSVVILPAFSYSAGNKALLFTNTIYQNHAVEPILVTGSLVAHILSGSILRCYKLYRSKSLYERWVSPISRLNSVSLAGYVAIPMLASHFYAVRWLPQHILGDSSLISLDYIANSLAGHPVIAITSMLSMLSLVLFHVSWGWKKWLKPSTKPKLKSFITGAISTGIVLGVASLVRISSQGAATGWLASQYQLIADASFI